MNAPALGSRVTVVERGGTFLGEVWKHCGGGVFEWAVPGYGGHSGTASVASENIDWCRGWHSGDSDEVKALKVARALGPESAAMDLHAADNLFKKGVMSEKAWLTNLDRWDAEFAEGRK